MAAKWREKTLTMPYRGNKSRGNYGPLSLREVFGEKARILELLEAAWARVPPLSLGQNKAIDGTSVETRGRSARRHEKGERTLRPPGPERRLYRDIRNDKPHAPRPSISQDPEAS